MTKEQFEAAVIGFVNANGFEGAQAAFAALVAFDVPGQVVQSVEPADYADFLATMQAQMP